MMLVLLLTWLNVALPQESDFVAQIDTNKLFEILQTKGLCSSSAAARFCRALPWLPSKNEGALEHAGFIYLFFNEKNLTTTWPMIEWTQKIPEAKSYEYVSYLLAMRQKVSDSMFLSSTIGLYIFILSDQEGVLKPRSIFFANSGAIKEQANLHEKAILEDLKRPIPEWLPPEDYDKSFQFKMIE